MHVKKIHVEKIELTDEHFAECVRILGQGDNYDRYLSNAEMVATFQRWVDTGAMPEEENYQRIAQNMTNDGNLTGFISKEEAK